MFMNFNRLIAMMLIMLGFAFNPVMAESGQPKAQAEKSGSTTASAPKEVWGDSEEEDETVWTWFGMGYEMRNRTSQSFDNPVDENGDSGSQTGNQSQKNK